MNLILNGILFVCFIIFFVFEFNKSSKLDAILDNELDTIKTIYNNTTNKVNQLQDIVQNQEKELLNLREKLMEIKYQNSKHT